VRQRISELFKKVKDLSESSNIAANKSWSAANEVSGGLVSSYSAAGDAEHARNTANLSIQKARALKELVDELSGKENSNIPKTVEAPCYILVEFENGNKKEIFIVKNPAFVDGYNLISIDSPIGNSLKDRGVEDYFYYSLGEKEFSGKILEIG
jgi:transcription elongation GreA/GreB family factor